MKGIVALSVGLFMFGQAAGQSHPRVYAASPVIHRPNQHIYTAFAVTNQTFVWSGETADFQSSSVDVFFVQGSEIVAGKRFDLGAAETVYFHSGDILGLEGFSGTVIILTSGRVGGSVYVRGAGEPLIGQLEEVRE